MQVFSYDETVVGRCPVTDDWQKVFISYTKAKGRIVSKQIASMHCSYEQRHGCQYLDNQNGCPVTRGES